MIQNIIKEFAEKYNFIQEKDIDRVETSDFNRQNYFELDNKPFISIINFKSSIDITIGKINIEIDTIEEEEWYTIGKIYSAFINISDYKNEDLLIETITNECKKHKLI
jgi:hypothetical protein